MAFKKSSGTQKNERPVPIKNRLSVDGVTREPVIDYLDHAPVSPIFAYTDGLFQSVPRGKSDVPLDVTAKKSKGHYTYVRFQAPFQLGVEEQSVFYYLCQQLLTIV